jgi:murein DD-endopeptidase MepM/ murein hydrolase activator NlpD
MMTYTVRFAHLEKRPPVEVGQTIRRGDHIGRMGNSGQSFGAHVHMDIAEGRPTYIYRLADLERGNPQPAPLKQALFFISDEELFKHKALVTVGPGDVEYFNKLGKVHYHYDVVPLNRRITQDNYDLYWPRSMPGTVTAIHWDPSGYGHVVYIAYEV